MDNVWNYFTDHRRQLLFDSYQHVSAVVQSVILATLIAVAIAVLTYRNATASSLANSLSKLSSVMENGTSDDARNQAPFSNVS